MFKQVCSALLVGAMCMPAFAQTTQRSQSGQGGAARQEQGPSDRPISATERDRERAQAGMGMRGDRAERRDAMVQMHLVQDLRLGNEKEIELSEFAQDEAQNDQVKEFAQQMVEAHRKMNQDLQQAHRQAMRGGEEGQDADTDIMAMPGGGGPLAQIHEEVCERQIESSKKMLGRKQGSEFDKAYMGMQIQLHQEMLDKLAVYQEHLPHLQQVLEEAEQHTEQHLEQAQQIMRQLDRS